LRTIPSEAVTEVELWADTRNWKLETGQYGDSFFAVSSFG